MTVKIVKTRWDGQFWVGVNFSESGMLYRYSMDEIRRIFLTSRTLLDVAAQLSVSVPMAIKALIISETNYLERLYASYLQGDTCRKIGQLNGIKPSTLSALFKREGFEVIRGRPPIRVSQLQLAQALFDKLTINAAARALNLHWATAKSKLKKHDFLDDSGNWAVTFAEVRAMAGQYQTKPP